MKQAQIPPLPISNKTLSKPSCSLKKSYKTLENARGGGDRIKRNGYSGIRVFFICILHGINILELKGTKEMDCSSVFELDFFLYKLQTKHSSIYAI